LAEAAQQAERKGAKVIIGSATDETALECACRGVDVVFHTESITQPSGDLEQFRLTNVEGTVNAATAAKQSGAQAFVQLSSALVYGFHYPDQITEEGSLRGEDNPFCQTKIESEAAVLRLNDPPHFGVIALRVGDVYGPEADIWVIRPLQLMQQRVFVLIDGGRGTINHLYIDNLVDGMLLALEQEAYGEVFNLTDGVQTSWKDYYLRLAEISGMSKPASMPRFLVKKIAQLKGEEFNFPPESIDFVTRQHSYSTEKAQRVLGFRPRISLDEGMARTAKWLSRQPILCPR
jgi:nucleoside-diphosphate-sugar epimerase